MLSITHHTRKRPSTGPRTTQGPQLPLDEFIDNTHITREKKKEKKRIKRNSNKRSKAKEMKRARSLEEEQISDPLGKGKGSTHPRQNHAQA
jgi:hypothetical protein